MIQIVAPKTIPAQFMMEHVQATTIVMEHSPRRKKTVSESHFASRFLA